MTRISLEDTSEARQAIRRMTPRQKELLADEIFQAQPNLLASVLSLSRENISNERLEVILNILFMSFEAARHAELNLPLVTEAVQDQCMRRIVGQSKFADGLRSKMLKKAVKDQIDNHSEKYLFALVFKELKDNGFSSVRTESDKLCVLAALNLVESIAYVAKDA